MKIPKLLIPMLLLVCFGTQVFGWSSPKVLSMRDRAEVRDNWLEARLDRVVPELLEREGIDMWVIISREYNEDPIFRTMAPATWLAARRRTILVFFDARPNGTVERFAVSRYDVGRFFKGIWKPEEEPDQWKRLADLIVEKGPRKIAVNTSEGFGLADGVSHSEYQAFLNSLPEEMRGRIVSGEKLAVGWLERRIPEEMAVYPSICRMAHEIIAEGLSDRVIQPGVTTTADVEWWFRERIRELRLVTWFHPSVSVERIEDQENTGDFSSRSESSVIQRGDLIHVDFGITYLGLNTDTQQHAYVLRFGETEAPEGLKRALAQGNRLQDILLSHFAEGRTGNQVLKATLEQAKAEGLVPSVYTHPIGFHGHAAGPAIGMWDMQDGVPITGDYPLRYETAYSIELNVTAEIPEWNGKKVRIMLEEDAFFDQDGVRFIDGRQTDLILIR